MVPVRLLSLSGLLFLLLTACHKTQPVVERASAPATEITSEEMHTGTVTTEFAEQGCAVLIKMEATSEHAYLIPIALDDKYKKDGLVLNFNYRVSRAHQGDCKKGQAAILEDISSND